MIAFVKAWEVYGTILLLLLWGNKTVLFSSPFRTSFAQQKDMFYKVSSYVMNQG
jgi:hypothetical protein